MKINVSVPFELWCWMRGDGPPSKCVDPLGRSHQVEAWPQALILGEKAIPVGSEEIPPPLEAALEGASEGDIREVRLEPADAFGERDLESIFSVPTDLLGEGTVPRSGDWIDMVVEPEDGDEFTEPYELEAQVVSVEDDAVILDTNHPLAGQEVTFQVTVATVSKPE